MRLLSTIIVMMALAATAQPRLHQRVMSNRPDTTVPAWVVVDDSAALRNISRLGADINARFGNLVTVTLPRHAISGLSAIPGVKAVRRAQRLELHNDMARSQSFAQLAGEGFDLFNDTLACTGRGVVLGVIDSGFDFNHINFFDNDGKSRIAAVYLPEDNSGTPPIVDGLPLPGSAYFTPDEIAALTTDNPLMSHGTHTTGTAAGSYRANGYRGIAPEATLVLCGMPGDQLTDANIANSVKFIFDYAERHNMPAVINMSLGSCDGAHDGTSPLCRALDEASGPGRVCVVSAGNQGEVPCHWEHKFTAADTIRTFFSDWQPSSPNYAGYASAWSDTATPHDITFIIYDLSTGNELYRKPLAELTLADEGYRYIDSDSDPTWAQYFDGILAYDASVDDNGRYNSLVEINITPVNYNRYALGMLYSAPAGETVKAWCSGMYFWSRNLAGWLTGTANKGISDMATTDGVISVGAYCSRKTTPRPDGTSMSFNKCAPYGIAYFSSFGPDMRGIRRPDVTAPGFALVSSASRFDSVSSIIRRLAFYEIVDGISYPYGVEYGTSMSTPVVAGAIALWLQADPTLDAPTIRRVLEATSFKDSYYREAQVQRWGFGKIHIADGLKYVTQAVMDVNLDGSVNVGDVAAVYDVILRVDLTHASRADVNRDGTVNAGDVSSLYQAIINQ